MNYLSVCSGVEAASVAWKGLGWNPLGFSEIEKFPSEVLQHHYPNVPNLGDMTKYKEWNFGDRSVDLVVGGTPCQSFSVAGLRKGMEDPRGNLALTFCAILDKFRPQWFVWENVPGVLSSNKGRDFGSFLGAVAELGYGASYRVLDAQNFGVPQRRRRVFVVGHLGDWKPTAEVLFEPKSLQWHPKKSRQTRKNSPGYIASSFGAYSKSDVGGTSRSSGGDLGGRSETFIHVADTAPTLTSSAAGFSRPGNDSTADSQYIAIAENTIGRQPLNGGNGNGFTEGGPMYTLNATGVHGVAHGFEPGIAKREGNPSRFTEEKSPTLRANMGDNQVAVTKKMAVRRLTPVECERLQGFPDNYTNIKENCPDGPRYKAMGNSMAVPVMKWIGERINNYKGDTNDTV